MGVGDLKLISPLLATVSITGPQLAAAARPLPRAHIRVTTRAQAHLDIWTRFIRLPFLVTRHL